MLAWYCARRSTAPSSPNAKQLQQPLPLAVKMFLKPSVRQRDQDNSRTLAATPFSYVYSQCLKCAAVDVVQKFRDADKHWICVKLGVESLHSRQPRSAVISWALVAEDLLARHEKRMPKL